MRTIAKFADAKGTIQGKALSVFLSILLTFCFMNVFGWNDFAVADETNGDTNTVVVEGSESGEPELQVQNISEDQNTVVAQSDTTDETTMTTSESTDETTGGSNENTGNENGAGSTEQTPVEPYVFDETTGTLTITGVEALNRDGVDAQLKELGITKEHITSLVVTECNVIEPDTFRYGYSGLVSVDIQDVNEIHNDAFAGSNTLKTVKLTNIGTLLETSADVHPTTKEPEPRSRAFGNCHSIESVILKNVGHVGREAFIQGTAITNLSMSGVKEIGMSAFSYCSGLSTLNIDATQQGVEKIGTNAFYECSGLREVSFTGHFDEVGTGLLQRCTGPIALTLNNMDVAEQMFVNCPGIDTVAMNNIGTVGKSAFYNCTGIKTAIINKANTVDQYAFRNCTNLDTVTMSGVDNIANYAFWYCSKLETVNSLAGVKQIGGFSFFGCEKLNGLAIDLATKMGYNGIYDSIIERVQQILAGKFRMDNAQTIDELTTSSEWTAGAVGKSENWNQYNNGTQIMEQARWSEEDSSVAEVKVDAYYTGEKQMDYIFVADLSASMAQLGNPEDQNARFYDMQSKLLDMTDKLLSTPGYDCKVAIVQFGGLFSGKATHDNSGFLTSKDAATAYINSLAPLNENTDYGLGMQEALALVQANTGRNTVVVFLSDGAPTVGNNTPTSGDLNGTTAAQAIKNLNVPIYGVLHSPTAAQHDGALAKMQAVCGENTVYESTDTESFGLAMNAAFTAVYGSNTVVVPVNAADFNISDIQVSAGTATYSNGAITWVINDTPFTSHVLTYKMSLTEDNANRIGESTYRLNNGNATFGDSGASVGLNLTLSRTVADPNATPEPGPTPDPVTPTPTPTTPAATAPAATPAAAPAAPAAAPAAPAAVIPDDANPLAAEPTDEGATIEDEENPLAAFDPDTDLNCWVHWLIIAGMLVTLVYGIAVIRRRNSFTNQITNFEDDLLGNTQDAANQAPAGAYSHAVR